MPRANRLFLPGYVWDITVWRGQPRPMLLEKPVLKLSKPRAAQLLAFWASRGWLSRVQRGLYVPIRLESKTSEGPLEDPWVVATALYSPCYIGGWLAAEHWGLTEQIFRSVLVITTKKPRCRKRVLKGTSFILRSVGSKAMFGLKPIWRGRVRVQVSDPARSRAETCRKSSLKVSQGCEVSYFRSAGMSPTMPKNMS